jgi:hypothetical protein
MMSVVENLRGVSTPLVVPVFSLNAVSMVVNCAQNGRSA